MGSVTGGYVAPATIAANVEEITFGVRKGIITDYEWYSCGVCGYFFPENEFQLFEGKRYCTQHRCFEDIEGIIEQRLEKRNIPKDEPRRKKI